MGEFGSGSWQSGKATTSNFRSLDVRQLQRAGWMTPGRTSSLTWTRNEEIAASIQMHAEEDRLTLNYRHRRSGDWKQMDYPVYLDWTNCNLGGRRPWFQCPASGCGRRVAVLYIGGAGIFACRHCYRLAYVCQRETRDDRVVRRVNTVRKKLGWKAGILNSIGGKPKGMHWSTFERLEARHIALASVALAGLGVRIGKLNERLEKILRLCR